MPKLIEVGAYRTTKQGVFQKKVCASGPRVCDIWKNVNQVVWVEANGEVPDGYICVLRPGVEKSIETITAGDVECISRAENIRRNSNNWPVEIKRAVVALNKLKKAISKMEKETNE